MKLLTTYEYDITRMRTRCRACIARGKLSFQDDDLECRCCNVPARMPEQAVFSDEEDIMIYNIDKDLLLNRILDTQEYLIMRLYLGICDDFLSIDNIATKFGLQFIDVVKIINSSLKKINKIRVLLT